MSVIRIKFIFINKYKFILEVLDRLIFFDSLPEPKARRFGYVFKINKKVMI
jgi:hypothetical protein